MKKIFFGLCILLGITLGVEQIKAAQTYYSDYGDFSDYSIEEVVDSELVRVEKERRYRFYEQEKIGEYRSLLGDNSKFDLVDLNDRKDTEFSDWQDTKPNDEVGRIIETTTYYKVKKPKPIKNITFTNTLLGTLTIRDIEVYYNGSKINYDQVCSGCNADSGINYLGYLTLDLKDYYDLQNIVIKIKSIDFNNVWEFTVLASVPSDDNKYLLNYYSLNIAEDNDTNIILTASDWKIASPQYYEEEIVDIFPVNQPLSIITPITMYRYQDPLYYFYNIQNRYVDGYFLNYDGLIKDEDSYQDYYRYQKRDKLEVADEIIITEYNQTLDDFINSTTDYEISSNLDLNNNGKYEVEIITDFITVKKEVEVRIIGNLKESNEDNSSSNTNDELVDNNEDKNNEMIDDGLIDDNKNNKDSDSELADNNQNNSDKDADNELINDKSNETEDNGVKNKNSTNKGISSQLNNDVAGSSDSSENGYLVNKRSCEVELEESLNRLDDSKKKLAISEQENKYLRSTIDDDSAYIKIKKTKLVGIFFIAVLVLILLLLIKKLFRKN